CAVAMVPSICSSFTALFFFNATAPSVSYTLSLHDALPIFRRLHAARVGDLAALPEAAVDALDRDPLALAADRDRRLPRRPEHLRSEEHTSELQSRENLVCRLLLEKKKNTDCQT